ncbi:MAG TPA: hypothetical protein VF995_05705 [Actinomycetota bacterium]
MNRNRLANLFRGRGEFQTLVMILAGWVLVTAALAAVLGLLHRIAPS